MAAANVDPIFSKVGDIQSGVAGSSANTKSDGTGTIGTDIFKVFTADSTNGGFVSRIRLSPAATTAALATTATVHRIYISSTTTGATTTTNCWLFQEVAAASQTADQTTTGTAFIEVPLGFALPPSYTILVSTHVVNTANSAWIAVVFGGKY